MAATTTKINLDDIQIASPCTENWDQMTGDERTRHCQKCRLNVYNIAEMTRSEAEQLIASKMHDKRVCVRIFRRKDGTILTKDCPIGLRRARLIWLKVQSLRVALVALILSTLAFGRYLITGKSWVRPSEVLMMGSPVPILGDVENSISGGISIQVQETKGKVAIPESKVSESK